MLIFDLDPQTETLAPLSARHRLHQRLRQSILSACRDKGESTPRFLYPLFSNLSSPQSEPIWDVDMCRMKQIILYAIIFNRKSMICICVHTWQSAYRGSSGRSVIVLAE